MDSRLSALTIHVPNVWQTCEWYRMVFGFLSITSADATAARLDVPGQRLVFAALPILKEPGHADAVRTAIDHPKLLEAFF